MSKVLIIDDDISHHRLAGVLIERYSIFDNYISYTDPKNALFDLMSADDYMSSNSLPDAILLDLNMPGIDGWQFLERLKRLPGVDAKSIPVFIVTSSIDPNDTYRSEQYAEVKGFFSKPISPETLRKIAGK